MSQTTAADSSTDPESTTLPRGRHIDVATRSYSWRPARGERRTALFRVYPQGAFLQHIRTVTIQQRTAPSRCEIDTDPELEDVPSWILDDLRDGGHALVTGGLE